MSKFKDIKLGDKGLAVKDVQERLCKINMLGKCDISGVFDKKTVDATRKFCEKADIEINDVISEEVWQELVNATYSLGDRSLYLRMPFFKGADCKELQQILGTLGFSPGPEDGVFGKNTENALRNFQQNMGLPNDGIVGAFTYQTIHNLHHSWEGKEAYKGKRELGLARVAEMLENNTICLFGTCDFSRSVAKRMSNLSIATTPQSKILSADALSVPPDESMTLLQIILDEKVTTTSSNLIYSEDDNFANELVKALKRVRKSKGNKISVTITEKSWNGSKEERSAQHYAINLLDSLCLALSHL